MSLGLLYSTKEGYVWTTGQRIARGAFATITEAEHLVRDASIEANRLREVSVAQIAAESAAAYDEGFVRGREEGMGEILGILLAEHRLHQLLSDRLTDLVEQCVRSMIGEMDAGEVFSARVRHLIKGMSTSGVTSLHVAPTQLRAALDVIDQESAASGADFSWLLIEADEQCPQDALLLETQAGYIDASITITMDGLRSVMRRAVLRATQRLGVSKTRPAGAQP